jgi:Two component regulator propeller
LKIYRQYLFFVIVCILNALPAFSQDYIVNYKTYGVEEGLLHREVNAIYQDSRGFIWMGIKRGFDRFDGYTFKSWTVEKDRFKNNDIWQILEDADGFFWLPAFLPFQDFDIWNPLSGERTTFRQKFGDEVFSLLPNNFVQSELDKPIFFSTKNPPGIASYHPETGLRYFPIKGFKELQIADLENCPTPAESVGYDR